MCILRKRKNDMHSWHNRVSSLHSVYLLYRWCMCTYAAVCCVGIQVLHVLWQIQMMCKYWIKFADKSVSCDQRNFPMWVQWIKGLCIVCVRAFSWIRLLRSGRGAIETKRSERISIWFEKHFVATNTHIYSLNEFKFLCLRSSVHTRWLVLHIRCSLVKRVHTHNKHCEYWGLSPLWKTCQQVSCQKIRYEKVLGKR